MTPHLTEQDLLAHHYGETDPSNEGLVGAHLAVCAECRGALARLDRLLALVSAGVDVDPAEGFEREAWRRLAPRLGTAPPPAPWWGMPAPRRLAWGMAAAGVVLAGVLVAQLWRNPASPGSPEERSIASAPVDVFRQRVLLADLGEHFERSERMLIDVVNTAHRTPADIRRGRARAEDLLSANRLYRQTAADVGEARMVDVLEELERLLVEMAAGAPSPLASDLDAVGRRAESHNLVFKVRMLSSELQDRQRWWAGWPADKRS